MATFRAFTVGIEMDARRGALTDQEPFELDDEPIVTASEIVLGVTSLVTSREFTFEFLGDFRDAPESIRLDQINIVELNGIVAASIKGIGFEGDSDEFGELFELKNMFSGDDTIVGAHFDDIARGFDGDDSIQGRGGADVLSGDDGKDDLEGGGDDDRLKGGAGNDTLDGGAGADNLIGDAGADRLDGGDGADRARGGAGADLIRGRDGADVLDGLGGADRLKGGADADVLDGGPGGDALNGGGGPDTAAYDDSPKRVVVDLADGGARGGDANGDALSSIENLSGSDHDDQLGGDDGPNRLDGGAGADRLNGGAGADRLYGSAGDDAVVWDQADSEVLGGAGLDALLVRTKTVDLTSFSGTIGGFEVIDMRRGGASATVLDAADVLDLSDTDQLTVLGDADDSLDAGAGWADGGVDAAGLQVYTQDVGGVLATLLVDPEVQTTLDIVA